MKGLFGSLAYGINSMLAILFLFVIVGVLLWLCSVAPNWWLIGMAIILPLAHLLDKYWWRNTETYLRLTAKVLGKPNKYRNFK